MKPRIVDVVFAPHGRKRWTILIGLLLALALHFSGGLAAWGVATWLRPSNLPMPPREHRDLAREAIVDLEDPPPAPKPVEPAPPSKQPSAPLTRKGPPAPAPKAAPPAPAQAGQVIAHEPAPDEPADLTGNTIVTGQGSHYAGGVTTERGTNPQAVPPSQVPTDPQPKPAGPDRSQPVSLVSDDWSCPWPHEADTQRVDEQLVVLRAVVREDGRAESVTILNDPGFGFGPAARECALRTHFQSARDPAGKPIRAKSPPIRVRFTR